MVGLIDKIVSAFKPRDTLNGVSESFCDSYYSSREGKLVLKLQKIASEYPFVEVGGLIHKTRDGFEISDFTVGTVDGIVLPNKDSYAQWHSHPPVYEESFFKVFFYYLNVPSIQDVLQVYDARSEKNIVVGPLYTVILENSKGLRKPTRAFLREIDFLGSNVVQYYDNFNNFITEKADLDMKILRNAFVLEGYLIF